jgi:integrase
MTQLGSVSNGVSNELTGGEMGGKRGNGEGTIYRRAADGRWLGVLIVGWSPSGRPVRKTVSAKTRSEAIRKFRELQRRVDDGLPAPDASITVAQLFERWREDVLSHQVLPSAADNYYSVAKNHIIPSLGRKKLLDLTTADIDRLIAKKLKEGKSVSTVRRIRSVFAQALDQAMRWGWVMRNAASLSRAPKATRKEGRTLTEKQARDFLKSLEGHRLQVLFTLMLATGLRRGEALGLMWKDFDPDKRIIRVRRQLQREGDGLITREPKTSRSRRVVNLPPQLVETLLTHRNSQNDAKALIGKGWQNSGFIFTTGVGGPLDPRNLLRDFKTVCQAAGLGDLHVHELRHSAASLMLASGVKLQVVSEVLGHASIRMTADVYGHILDPDRESAAAAMGQVLWGDFRV